MDLKVKSILREAERVLNMELKDESANVMTAEEMQKRTDDILAQMAEKGVSDKKLRKTISKVKEESVPKTKEYAMNNGQTKPGYNVQIATENQFITNFGLYHQSNDQGTTIPFLESFADRYGMQSLLR